jgi:hypothetical protein
MLSTWSKKDEWDDKDFGRPVGRNMMKQVNVILEDLKTIIEGKYADFVQATAGHAGTTKWVELIEDAYRAVTSTEHKSLHSQAELIKRKLQEASEDMNRRFGDPQPVSDEDRYWEDTYKKNARLKGEIMKKISYCQELVEIYIVYCISIYKYAKGLKGAKFENCELISYLQHEGLTKEVACNMCEKLGAISKQHLYYVNKEDIWGDEVNGKQLLDALVTELKAEEKRKNGSIRKQLNVLKRVQDEKESAP